MVSSLLTCVRRAALGWFLLLLGTSALPLAAQTPPSAEPGTAHAAGDKQAPGQPQSDPAQKVPTPEGQAQAGKVPDKDADKEPAWKSLFDGKTLDGWKATDFGGQGTVEVADESIVLGFGSSMTGITCQREFPKCDYEIQWEARRLDGVDFFGTLTFPVQDAFCSLVLGGWGGGVVGISSLNGDDASMNETTEYVKFTKGQWYRIRVEVRPRRIRAWIDDKQIVDVDVSRYKLTTRFEVRRSEPLGFSTYETRGGVRAIQYRLLPPEKEPAPAPAAKK